MDHFHIQQLRRSDDYKHDQSYDLPSFILTLYPSDSLTLSHKHAHKHGH